MILCCGEALIDMLPEATVSGEKGFVPHAGGAIFNTAVALGRLGAPVGMLTGIGQDMFGDQLRAGLEASHVDTSCVIVSDRPTTLAFVDLQDGQARYTFMDENSAGRMLTPADMPALPAGTAALYFGGISLACEPAAETYATLLKAEGAGRAVMIDPNIRPGFIKDEDRYRLRLNGMMAAADIVKVSDEDLNWFDTSGLSLEEKARTLLGQGPSLVIVTEGGAGATAFLGGGQVVHVPSKEVAVVDTVGAGDTFNAGVLAALASREALEKSKLAELDEDSIAAALDFGARVAAVTVSRAGANPPWRDEV